jgi:hypothetical protein
MKILSLLIVCFLIIGCQSVPIVYIHPTKTTSDFTRDKYECEKIAEASAAYRGDNTNPFMFALATDSELCRCLEQKFGWQRCFNCKPKSTR